MSRDRLVCGITSDTVRKLLLTKDKLTLAKAINICQINELSEQRIKELSDTTEVHSLQRRARTQKKTPVERKATHTGDTCDNCGSKHAKQREACPANGKECRACGKLNHFQKVCRSKGKKFNPKPHPTHRHTVNLLEDNHLSMTSLTPLKNAGSPLFSNIEC